MQREPVVTNLFDGVSIKRRYGFDMESFQSVLSYSLVTRGIPCSWTGGSQPPPVPPHRMINSVSFSKPLELGAGSLVDEVCSLLAASGHQSLSNGGNTTSLSPPSSPPPPIPPPGAELDDSLCSNDWTASSLTPAPPFRAYQCFRVHSVSKESVEDWTWLMCGIANWSRSLSGIRMNSGYIFCSGFLVHWAGYFVFLLTDQRDTLYIGSRFLGFEPFSCKQL